MKKFLKGDPKPIIFNESKYRFSKRKNSGAKNWFYPVVWIQFSLQLVVPK